MRFSQGRGEISILVENIGPEAVGNPCHERFFSRRAVRRANLEQFAPGKGLRAHFVIRRTEINTLLAFVGHEDRT